MTGADIRAMRDRLGLSQQALADLINGQGVGLRITHVTVSRWERDEHTPSGPAATVLRRLAGAETAPRESATVSETVGTYDGAIATWEAERAKRLATGERTGLADQVLRVLRNTRESLLKTTTDD